jgi:hypothetical protein
VSGADRAKTPPEPSSGAPAVAVVALVGVVSDQAAGLILAAHAPRRPAEAGAGDHYAWLASRAPAAAHRSELEPRHSARLELVVFQGAFGCLLPVLPVPGVLGLRHRSMNSRSVTTRAFWHVKPERKPSEPRAITMRPVSLPESKPRPPNTVHPYISGHQLEAGGEPHAGRRADHGDLALLQRLPQRLAARAAELGQLVEEQHAEMNKAFVPGASCWPGQHNGHAQSSLPIQSALSLPGRHGPAQITSSSRIVPRRSKTR